MKSATTKTLSNGLTLITVSDYSKLEAVYFQLSLPVGAAHEGDGEHGFSHLIEHVISDKLHDSFDQASWIPVYIRDTFSAAVYSMNTIYSFAVPKEDLSQAIAAIQTIFAPIDLPDDKLQTQFGVITEESLGERDTLESRHNAYTLEGFYGLDSSLGRDPEAFDMPESVGAVLEFRKRYYLPDGAILAVAGEIDTQAFAAELERVVPEGSTYAAAPLELMGPNSHNKSLALKSYKAEQVRFGYIHFYPWRTLKDDATVDLLAEMLQAYLWRYLRDKGLIYDLAVDANTLNFCGTFEIVASFAPGKVLPFYMALEQGLRAFSRDLTDEQYGAYVHHRTTTMMIDRYFPRNELDTLAWYYQLTGETVSIADLCAVIQGITRAEILTVFNQLFADNGKVFILGTLPKSDRDAVKQQWDKWWQSNDAE